ncbi:MAG: hypothetical protein EZS28_031279 [Streblomastix strix]|uniref:Uncharacterized protein n=1 Tax=Streblomastix strix TaxID=222440 RepID=A0A5J4US72_9EUKA|nr:MAG: hypothetical protein EZS28_031279 [Streblomastix strix]
MQENENRFFQERLTDEEMIEDIRKLDYIIFHEVNFEDSDALMLTEPMLQAPFRRQLRLHDIQRSIVKLLSFDFFNPKGFQGTRFTQRDKILVTSKQYEFVFLRLFCKLLKEFV